MRVAHEYIYGIGRPQEIEEGLKIYMVEADKGTVDALNAMGQLYYEGKIVPIDLNKVIWRI